MDEMQAMRGLIEGQFAQLAWSDAVRRQPLRAQFTRDLLASGFSAALARQITQHLPDDYSAAQAREWLVGVIGRNLRCADAEDDLVTRGGVYALVGPTGVGKTTTTAKLAARCAVRYGARALALLTTDSYRIGAQDQLRIYAKILGVNVHTVTDATELRSTLDTLSSKHLVLIDTVGMGQRDSRVAEHTHWLAQPDVKRLLLLNATVQAETLEEVVAAYGAARPEATDFAGSIITKIDEAARPGQALDVAIRHRLLLQYVSNGQRVPEDLHAPNANYLVHRSLRTAGRPATDSPFALQDDELALLLAENSGVAHA
jgi:flagellar biosynthesis protein FlhF